MDEVLVADGVEKRYGDTVALAGVSLTASAGEVLALVGPNGAGKTTLVRALTGTTVPDDGSVLVLGEPPSDVDRAAMGVLPQAFSPPDRLTARELLRYYAGLYDDARDPESVLAEIGLTEAGNTRYEALSGGQRRRVCLGAALVNDPTVLVLDEPTTGIDPAGRRRVRELIRELADGGATVLVTTHDMDEAERLADSVALLADGSLRASGTPGVLVDEYGGPPRLLLTPASDDQETAIDAIDAAGFDVEERDDTVIVADVRPEDIAEVVTVLDDAGVTYEQLEWRRPTLEDAYMTLAEDGKTGGVGRSARGRTAAGTSAETDAATGAGTDEASDPDTQLETQSSGGDSS